MGHKITSLGMVAANFEPSDQIDKGTALPMPHVAGKIWMIFGAIKFLMFFLVDNEVLKARRKLEGSLEAIEAPWTRWRIKEEDAESDVIRWKICPIAVHQLAADAYSWGRVFIFETHYAVLVDA
jgi:hypothetical protein